jgi:hypothetical protein
MSNSNNNSQVEAVYKIIDNTSLPFRQAFEFWAGSDLKDVFASWPISRQLDFSIEKSQRMTATEKTLGKKCVSILEAHELKEREASALSILSMLEGL